MLVLRPARRPGGCARCRVTILTAAIVGAGATGGPAFGAAADDQQLALAGAGAIKILVRGTGWIHVGQPALVAAGMDPLVDPAKLQLYADGVEQAIAVTGDGNSVLTADEAIEFWGTGRDTAWTDTRTYWLVTGGAGARVAGGAPGIGVAAPASFDCTDRLVERTLYLASVRNGDASNFFGAAVSTTPTVRTLTARHLDTLQVAGAVVRVTLQGVTATNHAVDVVLNGTPLGTCTLQAQEKGTFSFPAPNVVEGDNQLTLTARTASDYTGTVSLELAYPRAYVADGDALAFTATGGVRVAVGGFTTSDVRIVDVTDGAHPIELPTSVSPGPVGNVARADVPPTPGTRQLYAFTGAKVAVAAAVTRDAPSSWAASHDGELLIIAHAAFLDALAPLVARRAQEGWSVQIADVQDVYDEQGFGDKSAAAIRAFIQRARAGWRVPPRFVLLAGDATFDPRNFLGKGDFDFMPTRLIDTAAMETASDDWFVDDDLDGIPEVAIGRLPVRTSAQASAVVAKLLGYAGRDDLARGGLFVTDTDDVGLDFSVASAAAEATVSDIMPVDRFQRDTSGTPDALLAKLGAGPFLVNYLGHGSVEVWDGLLTTSQAAALTNVHPSIYVVMNCLNGFFHDLYTTSVAESLITAPNGGAVAVWASSSLAEYAPQPAFDQEFLMRVSRTSLGEASVAAKRRISDLETRRTWLLFGDPTLFGTPTAVPPPPVDGGAMDGGAMDAGADAGAIDAGTDAGGGIDAGADAGGAIDAGGTPDAGVMDAGARDTGTTPDGGADRPGALPASDGCGCDTGGGAGIGPGALGLSVFGLALGARRRRRRRRSGARAVGFATLALIVLAWAARAEAAYSYRMAITIDRTRIGTSTGATTLSNYPLLLDISSTNLRTTTDGGHVTNASGYDISFQGADTTTCGGPSTCVFNYEIESYASSAGTGRVIAWVNIPVLKTTANTANTVIYVKYGDGSVGAPTQNQNGTWNSNFKGVWHLSQSSTPQTDSTSTPSNASHNGSPAPASATGLVSAGVSTSSTTGTGYLDYRATKFNWTSSDTFTYQGWFKTSDNGPLFSQRDNGAGNPVIDITVGYNGATTNTNKMSVLVRDDTGVSFAEVNGSATVNDNAWHHFAVTRTGGTIEVYVDGASIGTATNAGASGNITTGASGNYQNIGREGNWVAAGYGSADQRYLAATFDEFRVSNTVRAAEWIKTDYNTQGTPASTYSLGAEVGAACGDGTRVAGESCDDGNIVSGDGCSNSCAVESGYTCNTATPNVCSTVCGDGIVAGSEGCDDGGTTSGNGCSATCTVETGYHCSGAPSTCTLALFNYYKTITIDRTKVGTASAPTTLSNYPVLISLSDSALAFGGSGHVLSSSGYDIIFRGLDTVTCGGPSVCTLPHQVESYSSSGTLVAWVNVAGLKTQTNSANTTFRIMYGNPAIAAAATSTERITSTWNSNFTGVWHLNQTPGGAGTMTDATTNTNGTPNNVSALAAGKIGAGVTMNGTSSYIAMNSGTTLNAIGAFTYSVWVNTGDTTGGIFSLRSSTTGNPVIDIMVGADGANTSSGRLMVLARDDAGGGQADIVASSSTFNNSAWHLVTATRSGSTLQLYLDATSIGTIGVTSGAISTDTRNLGREGRWVQDNYNMPTFTSNDYYLAGSLDEARASNVARNSDWVTTDYNNQNSPSTFITGYLNGTGAANGEVTTNSTTSVDLLSLDATAGCAGTTIAWQMAQGLDTLGFNVVREVNGTRVKLNDVLVPAQALSGGAGDRYTFVDSGPPGPGRTYWVEDVLYTLDSRWYGPVAPTAVPDCASVAVSSVPAGAPTPTAIPSGGGPAVAGERTGDDQMGGCAVGGGRVPAPLPLVLAAIALAGVRRRRRP